MISRSHRMLVECCLIAGILFSVESANAQGAAPAFDSAAIEAATTISNGVCSNPAVGISYQLPGGLKQQDSAAIREENYTVDAKVYGTGPEARWFLWGYGEKKQTAWLCGAEGKGERTVLMAMPARLVESMGPTALEQLVQSFGQQFGSKPSPVRKLAVNGLNLECSDVHATANSPARGKIELWVTGCAVIVGSYAVAWIIRGMSQPELKNLVASLNSVKLIKSQPLTPAIIAAHKPPVASKSISPGFEAQLKAFMRAWLVDRNTSKTMAFFSRAAFSAPPFIGNYCPAWYHFGASRKDAERLISGNLMSAPEDFPKGTPSRAIFTAWNRLPPRWLSAAANDVEKDHFLIANLDPASLDQIFSGVFATSKYGKYLRGRVQHGSGAYWVVFPEVMPDQDIFVIFTAWQKKGHNWKITDIDIVCQ